MLKPLHFIYLHAVFCCFYAGDVLTCPVYIKNTGNVGLQGVTLTSTPSACSTAVLEPFGRTRACNVSVTATQDDFDTGFAELKVQGVASPRTRTAVPLNWQGSSLVRLSRVGRMSVTAASYPPAATAAGEALCFN